MPRTLARRFTDRDQDKVKKFMAALLDYQKHPEIEAEWITANPGPYHLVVKKTTKRELVKVIYNHNRPDKMLQKYKAFIQTAMAYLEDLKILVRHGVRIGADAQTLRFHLRLPSQNKEEIFQKIFVEKWTERRQEFETKTSQSSQKTSQSSKEDVKIDVEQVVEGVEGGIIKYAVKFKGSLDAMRISQKQIHQYVRDMAEDPTTKIVSIREGCVIVEFEGSLEGFKRLESKINSGEITEILGFPILEIKQVEVKLTPWFDNIKVDDWLYDIGIQASRLVKQLMLSNNMVVATLGGLKRDLVIESNQLDNIVSQLSPKCLSDIGLDSSKNTSEHILISLLNSGNLDWMKFIAYQIGELTTVPTTVIDTLATCITTIQDSETRWQLALTLAKLDPEHPLGAVGQTKTIEFSNEHWFDLFLALRVGEDDLIDVLVEVTSATDEYLPVGLQVSLLDETEEVFLEVLAKEEARYLSLEFTGAISQFFSIKFSLEDNDLIDNFVI